MLDRVFGWREEPSSINPVRLSVPQDGAPGIALALGGGAARGWAHIGVLKALDESGIRVSMIAGTSIGALVGGCYLAGKLDELEAFALSLTRRGLIRFLDFRFGRGGLIGGLRLSRRLAVELQDIRIEDLDRRLICVASDAQTGHEVWLDSGSLVLAMRASYALPGVFEPVVCGGRRLMDGALVNPVPVNVCRVFEHQMVMAVNLHYDLFGRAAVLRMRAEDDGLHEAGAAGAPAASEPRAEASAKRREKLGVTRSMVDAFNIIQDRISRSRLAGDPPDLSLQPRVRDIGLWEFFRAEEAIAIGYETTISRIADIRRMVEAHALTVND
ncbi:patatin-like phospholipase family protein [Aurantimonas sp. VKM B-3413]|uniref:patatin-like phospholipase family protein n=1 Tax=Aurantimonas sp. VKM B-3413 TaxID=2779401 RepID=UPI001E28C8F9|nr:patatin-like phospholipase family protein [Aurantimonas sp. VKM B-3413]MCB8840142.1 patatin-like phospholipase family protein [Aurantimonas sp. VKM B-3413]